MNDTATKKRQAHFSALPGGSYTTKQNENGTFDVLRVPFFSVLPKGVKGSPKPITSAELQESVQLHQRMFRDDRFLPRLNVLHNYTMHRPTPAGFFLPTDVGSLRMKGKQVPVVFCDLVGVPEQVVVDIGDMKLPYCSVEIRSWEPLQFGALALLDTEPPFFEFPLISLGARVGGSVQQFKNDAALALFSSGRGDSVLFRFEEDEMPDDDDMEPSEAKSGGDSDIRAAVAEIESQLKAFQPILDLLPKLQEIVSGTSSEPEMDAPDDTDESPAEPEMDNTEAMMSADKASLLGRVAALEGKVEENEREKERERQFSTAIADLRNSGVHLTTKQRHSIHQMSKQPKAVFSAFIASFKDIAPKDPPEDLYGESGTTGAMPPEVMAYANKGPAEFNAAKIAWREHRELAEHPVFSVNVTPLDRYIKREISRIMGEVG